MTSITWQEMYRSHGISAIDWLPVIPSLIEWRKSIHPMLMCHEHQPIDQSIKEHWTVNNIANENTGDCLPAQTVLLLTAYALLRRCYDSNVVVYQAVCRDNIFPYIKFFGKGYGAAEEPRRAYLLSFFIAVACVAIGWHTCFSITTNYILEISFISVGILVYSS